MIKLTPQPSPRSLQQRFEAEMRLDGFLPGMFAIGKDGDRYIQPIIQTEWEAFKREFEKW